LHADLAVFVGDFGNENVNLVKNVASLDHPKAVILGNHDAWNSLTKRARGRARERRGNGIALVDAVAAQLEALGPSHVGFGSRAVPVNGDGDGDEASTSSSRVRVVGVRPFSRGGGKWAEEADFYMRLYGLGDASQSARRVVNHVLTLPAGETLVLVGHNGPSGLGEERHDPVGRGERLDIRGMVRPRARRKPRGGARASPPRELLASCPLPSSYRLPPAHFTHQTLTPKRATTATPTPARRWTGCWPCPDGACPFAALATCTPGSRAAAVGAWWRSTRRRG